MRVSGAVFTDAYDGDEAVRILAVPTRRDPSQVLVAAAELDPVQEAQAALLQVATPLGVGASVIAGLAGWLVARRGLSPVARMAAAADAIGARDLSLRLPLPESEDELTDLARTLNGLLGRIEAAWQRERQFTADASHELRTPLAILRAELELAQQHTDEQRLVVALDSALEEADRLGHLIDDLLLLARLDAGAVDARAPVDVAEVADDLVPRFQALAARRGITLTSSGDAVAWADVRALTRALSNLLDNAVRHAPDRGHVALNIAVDAEPRTGTRTAVITVTDDGPGVPPHERRKLTERFSQLQSPAGAPGGAGLGLAIVASVAASHGGSMDIGSVPNVPGLAVTLRLPATPPSSRLRGSWRSGAAT